MSQIFYLRSSFYLMKFRKIMLQQIVKCFLFFLHKIKTRTLIRILIHRFLQMNVIYKITKLQS